MKTDILERLDALMTDEDADIDHCRTARDAIIEIRRLRAALAVVADPRNWFQRRGDDGLMGLYHWNGTGEFADPMAWAAREAAWEEPDNG